MPINIFAEHDDTSPGKEANRSLAWLCDDNYELPTQLYELERWLETKGKHIPAGNYIADIGFTPRKNAFGGGGALSVNTMKTLVSVGIEVWFSEYPAQSADNSTTNTDSIEISQ